LSTNLGIGTLVIAVFLTGLIVLPLRGHDLSRLNNLHMRNRSLALAALVTQVAIISVWPNGWRLGHLIVHLSTYAAIGVFLWANRHIPWLWIVTVGIASNAVAIALNGGVMPASATAMSLSHLSAQAGFANSASVAHPRLLFLGDIIPTPPWLPLHNVASIGDLLITAGAILLVAHQTRRISTVAI
jgi:hypothetical protein